MKPKRSRRRWTDEEIAFMMDHYGTMSIKEIARELGRTENAIKNKAKKLGLSKLPQWSDEEIKLLVGLYGRLPAEEIAKILGRSKDAVYHKAMRLGLQSYRLPDYLLDILLKYTLADKEI